jgi:hypothetical protein
VCVCVCERERERERERVVYVYVYVYHLYMYVRAGTAGGEYRRAEGELNEAVDSQCSQSGEVLSRAMWNLATGVQLDGCAALWVCV